MSRLARAARQPAAFEELAWIGTWLTDGESLVQVTSIQSEGFLAEDARTNSGRFLRFDVVVGNEATWVPVTPAEGDVA